MARRSVSIIRSSSPRVAIIGTRGYPSYYGGFETATRRLAPYLSAAGWQVRVYARPGKIRVDDPTADPSVETIVTSGINRRSLSTLTYGLTAVLHAFWNKPDVALVMNCANGYWLPILRLRGIPVITNVDGIEWERDKWNRLAKLVFRLGARLTALFSHDLVFDAHAIAAYWRTNFNRTGNYIAYGGEPTQLLPLSESFTSDRFVLLVARFVPENSVHEFMEAAPAIAQHVDVVLVGSDGIGGPLDRRADELSRTYENIHWLGHINDDKRLFSLWQHAAVYFHGHTVGGTNPALVQAMALGARIVARDTIYNREVLADTGTFCGPTAEEIAATVLQALEPADNLRRETMDRALTDYSWEKVCADYEHALRQLLLDK